VARQPLSPSREARLRLAFYEAWDVRGSEQARPATEHLIDLYWRLNAEQGAERGVIPETAAGCIATLNVAARILAILQPQEWDA